MQYCVLKKEVYEGVRARGPQLLTVEKVLEGILCRANGYGSALFTAKGPASIPGQETDPTSPEAWTKKKKAMKSPLKCGRKRGYDLRGKELVIMVCA